MQENIVTKETLKHALQGAGGGKTLYRHNIQINHGSTVSIRCVQIFPGSDPNVSITTLGGGQTFTLRMISGDNTPINSVAALAEYLYAMPQNSTGLIGYGNSMEQYQVRSTNGTSVQWAKRAITGSQNIFFIEASSFYSLGTASTVEDTVEEL